MGEAVRRNDYLKIALPAAAEGFFMVLLSSVDIIMVGFLGTAAIAAVSIFTQPRMMLLAVSRSVAATLTLLVARRYGAKENAAIGRITGQTIFASGIILLILHIIFFCYLTDLLLFMGAEENYLSMALSYGNIALIGAFFTSIAAIMQGAILGLGKSTIVLKANLAGNIINVIANAVFIFGFNLGVVGAALGTVVGTFYSLLLTINEVRRTEKIKIGRLLPDKNFAREFGGVFLSVFSEQGFERIGMVLYTKMVAGLGTSAYAIHAICMNFCDFYYSFAGGLGKASMVLAGHDHGAGNVISWQRHKREGYRWGLIFSAAAFFLTLIFREEIFAIYSHDSELLPLGSFIIALVALASFPEAQNLIAAGILRGSGKTKEVALYTLVSITIMRPIITAVFIYELNWGLTGAWLALLIDQGIRATLATILVRFVGKNDAKK